MQTFLNFISLYYNLSSEISKSKNISSFISEVKSTDLTIFNFCIQSIYFFGI